MVNIKFSTTERNNGESYKQHAFKPYGYYSHLIDSKEVYANASLCNHKFAVGDENEDRECFDFIESEPIDKKNICKKCLKIFNTYKTMHANLLGAYQNLNKFYHTFEHRGRRLQKDQVKKILLYGIKKGYKTTAEFTDEEVDNLLNIKSN